MLMCAAPGWASLTPVQRCQAGKNTAAGKYAACRQKAEGTLVTNGSESKYDTTINACKDKFSKKWFTLESTFGQSSGQEAAMEGYIANSSSIIASALNLGFAIPACGDFGVNVPGEECDGNALNGRTCASLGFDGGTLSCTGSCKFDTSACTQAPHNCGNGTIDGDEVCDQGDLNGATCGTLGYVGGTLACGADCAFDDRNCYATRFVDNHDGTITDNQTGLQWERTFGPGNGNLSWAGKCEISGNFCQSSPNAATACNVWTEGSRLGCAQCGEGEGTCIDPNAAYGAPTPAWTVWDRIVELNAASFAQHYGWRVPKLSELESIIDLADATPPMINVAFHAATYDDNTACDCNSRDGCSQECLDAENCTAACTDMTSAACACTPTDGDYFWTATIFAPNQVEAWCVNFRYGGVSRNEAGLTGFGPLRAVRSLP
ncbi:MAG TPA: DUF1566 domain-containing protein [Candidatus Binatia bacterium]